MSEYLGGAHWYRGDFQIYTPASRSYGRWGVTAEDLWQALRRLDFAVVADHNTFDGYLNLLHCQAPGAPVLFPGVELKVAAGFGGISLVVILNPLFSPAELEMFLRELGLQPVDKGEPASVLTASHRQVAAVVGKYDGIVLWNTGDSKHSLLSAVDEAQRQNILALPWPVSQYNLTEGCIQQKLPGIWSSSARRPQHIGKASTWVKMEQVDFAALRFALQEPSLRVGPGSEAKSCHHPYIRRLTVTGGFFQDQEFWFNPGLNCVVGPRGTGKSTLHKLLAFALGHEPEGIATLLGDGEVEMEVVAGQELLLRRRLGQPLRVHDKLGRMVQPDLRRFASFFGQGEVERVALDKAAQLKLLDALWDSGPMLDSRSSWYLSLQANGSKLMQLGKRLDALTEELADHEHLSRRVKELCALPLNDIQAKLAARDREVQHLEQLRMLMRRTKHNLEQLADCNAKLAGEELLAQVCRRTARAAEDLTEAWEQAERDLDIHCEQLHSGYVRLETEFEDLLGGLPDKQVRLLLKERKALQGELVRLEPLLQEHLELEEEHRRLRETRTELWQKWTSLGEEIFEKRLQTAAAINQKLAPWLRLEVTKAGDSTPLRAYLDRWLAGAGSMKGLSSRLSLKEWQQIIRDGDPGSLASKSGLALERCRQITMLLGQNEAALQLEALELPDLVTVYLRDGSKEKCGSRLSTGQRCTAVLPLLLLAGDGPLLIDQPEDQLDNAYIYTVLVQRLQGLKEKRQFIFATHNPNIPVLADAEQNFILESDGQNGQVRAQGYIACETVKNLIQEIMEGGKDAFLRRARCYGGLALGVETEGGIPAPNSQAAECVGL